MENKSRLCRQCGTTVLGRSDKKYCSDQCRAVFNNLRTSKEEKMMVMVNAVLRKNRSILKYINPKGNSTVRKEFLEELGFNFKYFTSIYTTKAGSQYCFCYDRGFMLLQNGKVLLVNYQDYMKD